MVDVSLSTLELSGNTWLTTACIGIVGPVAVAVITVVRRSAPGACTRFHSFNVRLILRAALGHVHLDDSWQRYHVLMLRDTELDKFRLVN